MLIARDWAFMCIFRSAVAFATFVRTAKRFTVQMQQRLTQRPCCKRLTW